MAKRSSTLNRAYSYWRLARKAERAGQSHQARHYRGLADRLHRQWKREQEEASRRAR